MTDFEFNDQIDELIITIEDAIEESGLDIDYENSGGILTLTCPNGSQIILSRQTALSQLWVAARSGGFHLDFDEQHDSWLCNGTGETLEQLLNRCLTEQTEEPCALVL